MKKEKIPGMLYILISFIPWINYWILCGKGNKFGIIISLIISLFLILPEIYKREFNLMDLASVFYFTTAFIATYLLKVNIFVEKSGSLGYFGLFLMATISLILKNPFTFQVSKRDYPEIYLKEKSFIMINNVITAVWAFLFLINSIIFLLADSPLSVILSNILIVLGILFSIFFPIKGLKYFVVEKRKDDWDVKIDLKKPKRENEYDVIIVGSGIGGMTCGALLSKRGYKVLILEQHYEIGGYCSSFKIKDFIFNTGVENVSGLWEKGPINLLLKELGLKKDDLFVKNRMRYIYNGKQFDIEDINDFTKYLFEMFPEEEKNIILFFEEAKKAYEECYKEADIYGTPLPGDLIVKVFGEKKLLNYPAEHPHFYKWMNRTFQDILDEYFSDSNLKTLLCALMGYVGTQPEETPASNALTAVISYYIYGGYSIKGGAVNFANSLRKVIEKYNGKVLLKSKVDKIIVKDGKVAGVIAKDREYLSSIVVANANAKITFLELVGRENLDRDFVDYIKNLKMSPSVFMVFLGVDMDLSNYPTIINNLDGGYGIVINSNADSSLAPEGMASVAILTGANYFDFPDRGTQEYIRKKRELKEVLIKKAEEVIPGLSKHMVVQSTATPKTLERYTLMPEGAMYSFDQSINTKRPYFKTPIDGLYLASASTFPGGGIEAVVISGTICANDICGWKVN